MTVGKLLARAGPDATLGDVTEILDGVAKLRRACDAHELDAEITVQLRDETGIVSTVQVMSRKAQERSEK